MARVLTSEVKTELLGHVISSLVNEGLDLDHGVEISLVNLGCYGVDLGDVVVTVRRTRAGQTRN